MSELTPLPGLKVSELFPDDGVQLTLHCRRLVQISEGQDTEDLVELANLTQTEVLQVIQHCLNSGGRGTVQ